MDQLSGSSETLRMGSSLDHLIAKGYLYGFGYEPAMCLPGPRSGPLAPDFPDQRLAWLVSAWWPAPTVLLGGRGPRRASPGRRAGRSTSSTNKAPQNAAESPPKPAAPPRREQRLTIPRAGAGRNPPSPGPDLSCLPSPQWLTREISKKSQNPLGGGHAAAGTTPTGNLRPAREGLRIPLTGSGRCAAPTCRGARHAGANAFGVDGVSMPPQGWGRPAASSPPWRWLGHARRHGSGSPAAVRHSSRRPAGGFSLARRRTGSHKIWWRSCRR